MTPYDPEFDPPEKIRKLAARPRLDQRSVFLILVLVGLWLWIAWGSNLLGLTFACLAMMFSGVIVIALALIPLYLPTKDLQPLGNHVDGKSLID